MPSCQEPEAFDLGVALWHFLLVPVLTQANGSGLKNLSLHPRAPPHLPSIDFLPISILQSARQPAAKMAVHTLVIFAHSQCLFPYSTSCVSAAAYSHEVEEHPHTTG